MAQTNANGKSFDGVDRNTTPYRMKAQQQLKIMMHGGRATIVAVGTLAIIGAVIITVAVLVTVLFLAG